MYENAVAWVTERWVLEAFSVNLTAKQNLPSHPISLPSLRPPLMFVFTLFTYRKSAPEGWCWDNFPQRLYQLLGTQSCPRELSVTMAMFSTGAVQPIRCWVATEHWKCEWRDGKQTYFISYKLNGNRHICIVATISDTLILECSSSRDSFAS